jgi:hypothetical protein
MEEKTYQVAGFSGVALTNQGDLTIHYGAEESLVVEAEANLLPYLEARVVDDTLHIGTRPGVWLRPTRPIHYRLTVTEFSAIEVRGSGSAQGPVLRGHDASISVNGSGDVKLDSIEARDTVEIKVTGSGDVCVPGDDAHSPSVRGDQVQVTITGSGDADLGQIEADRLEVRLTGSGDLVVQGGGVEHQTISTSGTGVYRARDLESATAAVRVSGSGNVILRVADELEARVTGSGDVRYAGYPAVREDTDGSGDVKPLGEPTDASTN